MFGRLLTILAAGLVCPLCAQEKQKPAQEGVELASQGRCPEAMPLLDQAMKDPDVLFLAVHMFSDLSLRNAQELMNTAPDSPLVIQLNAENFEKQGDLARAVAEYRILLQRVPDR